MALVPVNAGALMQANQAISRHWCLTFNLVNYQGDAVDPVEPVLPQHPSERFAVWQLEAGDENGNLHIQAYIEFHRAVRRSTICAWFDNQGWPRPHAETRRGTRDQAKEYCEKEETRVAGPWSRGNFEEGGQGRRNDIHDAVAALKEGGIKRVVQEHATVFVKFHRGLQALATALDEAPRDAAFQPRRWQQFLINKFAVPADDRTIYWVFDAEGGKGKSRLARHLVCEHNAIMLEGKIQDMAYMYEKQRIVIFDISRAQAEKSEHLYSFAEKLKNGMIVSTKYESKQKIFTPPHVVFFSNSLADVGMWSADRCKIIDLSLPRWNQPAAPAAAPQPAPAPQPAAAVNPGAADPFVAGFA